MKKGNEKKQNKSKNEQTIKLSNKQKSQRNAPPSAFGEESEQNDDNFNCFNKTTF